ncbi:MAG: helix-turn-helix domain-containing protein [Bacteroidota bacterium]|jgi:hypothetical protein
MEAIETQNITNEMLMQQFIEMKSMLTNLQAEINSLKNPVEDFTSKWVDTYDVMAMLRVSRRTIDNYIKAGKLTPTQINKRNYFAINQVKGLIHIPEIPKVRSFQEDIQRMIQAMASLKEED